MMNSYHYCYFYCYDYDDYPSCCCCSILLNDFLSLDERDPLNPETCLIFSVPQKDNSNGRQPLTFHSLSQTSSHHSSTTAPFSGHGFHKRGWKTLAWCSCRLIGLVSLWWPLPFPIVKWTMHTVSMLIVGLFPPLSPQSVVVCSPNGFSLQFPHNCGWIIFLYNCPAAPVVSMVPSPLSAGYLDVVKIFPKPPIKKMFSFTSALRSLITSLTHTVVVHVVMASFSLALCACILY